MCGSMVVRLLIVVFTVLPSTRPVSPFVTHRGRLAVHRCVSRPKEGMLVDCSEGPALPEASRGSWALTDLPDPLVLDRGRSPWGVMFPAEPHRSQDLWDERLCFH